LHALFYSAFFFYRRYLFLLLFLFLHNFPDEIFRDILLNLNLCTIIKVLALRNILREGPFEGICVHRFLHEIVWLLWGFLNQCILLNWLRFL